MTVGRSSWDPPETAAYTAGCVTCGDAASWLLVLEFDAGAQTALCADGGGRTETVATELVGPVLREDRLLVHAGTAIHREPPAAPPGSASERRAGA